MKEGKSFVPKYLRLLSYGGSASPGDVLREVWVDVNSSDFWKGGFNLVKRMVRELTKL